MLHRHGALACFDYAAAGPYLPIDMARQGRGLPLPAQVRRRPGHARACSSPSARSCASRAVGAGRRHGRVRQPDASRATTRTRRSARRRGRRRSSSRSAPASCSRSRRRSAPRRSAAASSAFARRALASWAENPNLRILGNPALERLAIVSLGDPPPARDAALELRRRAAQRPVRDPGAQRLLLRRPVHPPHVSDRSTNGRRRCTRRPCSAARARSSASPASASTTSSARRSSTTSSRRSTCSRTRAGSCCRSTASTPPPGLWHHASAGPQPAADPRRPVGSASRSRPRPRASLARQLEQARRIIGAIDVAARRCPGRPDRFRWFPLPDEVAVSA